ncbi:hypothetical protein ACFWY6_40955 [Streptomyces sp. NPDC059037]|uniref:hypothetical protein n=1 Tax=Streptomyces sp. NPDC059037 TaxID=3346710 RepID=UPI0036BC9AAD
MRGGLNVESGLNDGMALPFFVLSTVLGLAGSGFIAAWVAGFAFGVSLRQGAAADAPPVDEKAAARRPQLREGMPDEQDAGSSSTTR